jgi:hypothetical protein
MYAAHARRSLVILALDEPEVAALDDQEPCTQARALSLCQSMKDPAVETSIQLPRWLFPGPSRSMTRAMYLRPHHSVGCGFKKRNDSCPPLT